MISKDNFICPNCNNNDRQRIIFLGSDFSYQCKHCLAIHVFVENLYSKFQDNFKHHGCGSYRWKINRYIGTYSLQNQWLDNLSATTKNDHEINQYNNARKGFEKIILDTGSAYEKVNITKEKISNKNIDPNNSIFIANAINNKHFQESFRAIVRIKERALEDKESYKILIAQPNMDICRNPISKLEGIDEIWTINNWNYKMDWYYLLRKNNEYDPLEDIKRLSYSLTKELNLYDNHTETISKRPGPIIQGIGPIKDLLHTPARELRDHHNKPINDKYLGILIRKDYPDRAGLETTSQIQEICNTIKNQGFRPMIIVCDNREEDIYRALQLDNVPILIAKNLEEQVIFYNEHCYAIIGTNCSGCNLPALYNIPMFILAKTRFFPDDFYCMGRLLSPYDCNKLFNGDLTKPDNVKEVRTIKEQHTSIKNHAVEFEEWLCSLGKHGKKNYQNITNKKLAFIYTYGRIGSTSLFRSISNKTDAHHFHNFKPYFDNHLNTTNSYTNIEHLLSSQESIYIATGVRDPIARTISALFTWITKEGKLNNLTQYSGGGKYFLGHDKEEIKKLDINLIIQKLLNCLSNDNMFDQKDCWFNNNIRNFFNIDIYNYPFDTDQGHIIINQDQYRVLVYRQENLKNNHEMINSWLNTNDILLVSENESKTKWYYDLYKKLLENIKFSQEILDKVYDNKKIRYFYSDTEISNFYKYYLS